MSLCTNSVKVQNLTILIKKFLFRLFLKRGLDASDRFHDSLIMNNVLLWYNTTQTSSFDRIMYCPTADVTQ